MPKVWIPEGQTLEIFQTTELTLFLFQPFKSLLIKLEKYSLDQKVKIRQDRFEMNFQF